MSVVLAALAVAAMGADVPLVDGGFCTGLAWVPVEASAIIKRTPGPDFDVVYVDGPGDRDFGVYSGGHPQVAPDAGKPLMETEGLAIQASHQDGHFGGYLVGNDDYLKNHFFGKLFAGSDTDLTFFKRVAFGKAAAAKCAKPTGTGK